MSTIRGYSCADLQEQCVRQIVQKCYRTLDGLLRIPGENFEDTIECPTVALVTDTPLADCRFIKDTRKLPFSQQFMDKYAHDLLEGTVANFVYDYHDRLFNWGGEFLTCDGSVGINQLKYVVSKLQKSVVTRRAIATTWYPHIDELHDDVPCLQLVQFKIRDGKLHMLVMFRSEDMLLGLGPNMYGLTTLQADIAEQVGVPVGTYEHVCTCPHLYYWRDQQYLEQFK